MNEILKQLMERGYGVTLSQTGTTYEVKNSNVWIFDNGLGITYQRILDAVQTSMHRSAGISQVFMSPKTYKAVSKLLGKK